MAGTLEKYPNLTPWAPGQNPHPGKPKGAKNFNTLIRDMVENPKYKVRLKDGTVVKNPGAKIVHQMALKAMEGDVQAATWLTKYGYGDKIDVTSGDEPISNQPTLTLNVGSDFAAYMLEKTRVNTIPDVVVDNTADNGSAKP